MTVNQAGDVTAVRAGIGHPLLVKAGEAAVAQWKFAPTGGGAGGTAARLTFIFRMADRHMQETESTPVFKPPYTVEVMRNIPVVKDVRSA